MCESSIRGRLRAGATFCLAGTTSTIITARRALGKNRFSALADSNFATETTEEIRDGEVMRAVALDSSRTNRSFA
jgi:hypothetical protein